MDFKVDNAIIMAAGMSSRFAPLSYEKPKGLLVVKGEILIERQIRQLHEAGVEDITIVVGFMKEKFGYLQHKFGVSIVDNDDYCRYNNTSTLMRVLDRLKNTYICSSDNYFTENVFESKVDHAYYAATYFPGLVNEWGLVIDDDGLITGVNHSPNDMWCMMGHVFFSSVFSSQFKVILEKEYLKSSTRNELWESVYERHLDELRMFARKYDNEIIHEFDSLDDLRKFDPTYLDNSGSEVLGSICRTLNCEERNIVEIEVIKSRSDDVEFRFMCNERKYIYNYNTKTVKGVLS